MTMALFMNSKQDEKLIKQYLKKFEGKSSQKVYQSEIKRFCEYYQGDLLSLCEKDMREYREHLGQNVKAHTLKRKFSILNQFFKFLEKKIKGFVSPIGKKYGDMITFQAANYVESDSFQNNLDHWLDSLLTESTKKTYSINVRLFFEKTQKEPRDLKQSDFIEYKNYLKDMNQKDSTIWNKFIPLNGYLKFLAAKDRRFKNPLSFNKLSLIPPKKDKGYYSVLNGKEIELLLQQPDTKQLIGIRDLAIIRLLLTYGLRAGEVCKLKFGDLETQRVDNQQKLWVKDRKGRAGNRKNTAIILNGKALESFDIWLNESKIDFENETPIFTGFKYDMQLECLVIDKKRLENKKHLTVKTIENIVEKHIKAAGIKRNNRVISPHAMRHTALTMLAKSKNVELIDLKYLAGHSKLETTEIYLHGDQSYENNVGKHHPVNI